MAHPKHKVSKQRRDKRRTHYKATLPTLATCSNCGATVMYHHVCLSADIIVVANLLKRASINQGILSQRIGLPL